MYYVNIHLTCYSYTQYPISDVVVGFEQTVVNVSESAGQVELCVIISQPNASTPVPFTFSLILNTRPMTAGML